MKSSVQHADLYSKKRWRCLQYLASEFWVKWKADYLQSTQAEMGKTKKKYDRR